MDAPDMVPEDGEDIIHNEDEQQLLWRAAAGMLRAFNHPQTGTEAGLRRLDIDADWTSLANKVPNYQKVNKFLAHAKSTTMLQQQHERLGYQTLNDRQ